MARIYKKGQLTLPKAVRDAAGLHIGDRVVVEARNGEIVVRRAEGVLECDPPSTGRQALPWPDARRAATADRAEAVVDEPAFAVEHGDLLRDAAATYRERSVDLHDCLLHHVVDRRGTRVLSFDADLRRLGTGERP